MITFTFKHELSAHALSFTLSEDSTAPDVVVSFSAFMRACGYSQKTIDDAFAEMVTLDAVINPPVRTDEEQLAQVPTPTAREGFTSAPPMRAEPVYNSWVAVDRLIGLGDMNKSLEELHTEYLAANDRRTAAAKVYIAAKKRTSGRDRSGIGSVGRIHRAHGPACAMNETGMKYLRAVFFGMVLFSIVLFVVMAWMEGVILGTLATLAAGLLGLLFIYDSGH